jgi:AcrR family transcriptional regulator
LLDAATSCFADRGLARTTLRDVSHAAGVTSGTLYFHFATKESLYIATYTAAVEEIYDWFEQAIEGVDGIVERLESILDSMVVLLVERRQVPILVLRAWIEHLDADSVPLPIPPRVLAFIERLADDAARRGEISRRHRRELMDVYRALVWGVMAVALPGMDDVASSIAGLKRLLRDELMPPLAARSGP